ncbi:MAG: hypothetical protein NVS3B2_03850 [Ramlibacter sp.]
MRTYAAMPIGHWDPQLAAYAPATIERLAAMGVKLVGIDTASIDPASNTPASASPSTVSAAGGEIPQRRVLMAAVCAAGFGRGVGSLQQGEKIPSSSNWRRRQHPASTQASSAPLNGDCT